MKPLTFLSLRRLLPFMLSLLAWLGLSAPVAAQTSGSTSGANAPNASGGRGGGASHTVRGKVFLPSGQTPEQRLRVSLELSTGGMVAESFTDSVGNFEFRSLANNTYKVTVHSDKRSFETTQETVEVYGNFTRTFIVQLYLRDKETELAVKTKEKLLSVADTQEVPKPAKKLYDKSLKLARDDKPQEAVKALQEALNLFPEYLHALNKLGEQYLRLNQSAEAQAMFEKALTLNEKFALPRINLGLLLVNLKRYPEAVKELETAHRWDDSYPMGHLQLGLALMNLATPDYDRAEKEIARALQMGGRELAYAHLYLFNLYARQKEYSKAAAQLEAYLKDAPNAPNAEEVRKQLAALKKLLTQQAGAPKQ